MFSFPTARAALNRLPRTAASGVRNGGTIVGAASGKRTPTFFTVGSLLALGAAAEVYRESAKFRGVLAEERMKGVLGGPEKKILVWGETGEGKSTLINHLKDQEETSAPTGPKGQTRDIGMYKGTIGGEKVIYIDMPGIGSRDMPFSDFMQQFQKTFSSVDGIIVCSKVDKNRLTLGTQLVQAFVDKCIAGSKKWDNIIFCGTQADRCSQEEIDWFRNTMKDEFNAQVEGNLSKVVVVSKSASYGGYTELENELRRLPSTKLECHVHRSRSGSLVGSFLQKSM